MHNILEKIAVGLTENEVRDSLLKHGTNIITTKKKDGFFKRLLMTLGDPIIKILLIALGIKVIFLIRSFDIYETIGIVIAIFLASFISTISEYGSEKAFEKLQEESAKIKCRVRRSGKIVEVYIDDVVTNDIVFLSSGDKIPADGIIIRGKITVDESSINGEAKEKNKYAIKNIDNCVENNRVFRGTVVYSNEAVMVVTSVGDKTFYGGIAMELQEKEPPSPLKIRLSALAKIISRIGYVGAVFVTISYLFSVVVLKNNFNFELIRETITNFPLMSGHILYALTLSVTIIVVAVPEGLPMMITLVLSSNMKRMLKSNVLVRKMTGIETAGNINILFTDKTGTITKGKLELTTIISGSMKEYKTEKSLKTYPEYNKIVSMICICNNDSVYNSNKTKIIGGNITDRAILSFFKDDVNPYTIIDKVPFDSEKKYSSITIMEGSKIKLFKGAPEVILPFCNNYFLENGEIKELNNKKRIYDRIKEVTTKGIRVLCLAYTNQVTKDEIINLTFVGLILIKDEVRKDAIEGLNLVKSAHIQTVMITGDNKDTAYAIGMEVGLINNDNDIVITSDELRKKTDEEVKVILPNLRIVSRSLPKDKSRLVRLSQEMDLVVGMTGDGVNDAPALKKADVGFAMGSGTEVSKEASDIVILDDNFLSISKAILYGRTIFKSIRKFIILQLTINMCAISLSIIGPFIGIETPVTVIQMLWINMVMDTLAGLAFAFEPALNEYMNEFPKKKNEPIINKYMLGEILYTGFYSSILCILFLKVPFIKDLFRDSDNNIYFMTAFFGLFIFIDIFNSFNARTNRLNLLSKINKNKVFIGIIIFIIIVQVLLIYHGGTLFRTAGLTFNEFKIMIIMAFTVIPIDWIRKLYLRFKGCKEGV